MDSYRFQNEMLEQMHRVTELLETIAWNTAPAKFVTSMTIPEDGQTFGAAAEAAVAAARGDIVPGGIEEMINVVHSMTGGGRRGEPPTPEQRAEKWAARAAQVGMPAEQAEEVRQRAEAAVAGVTASVAPCPVCGTTNTVHNGNAHAAAEPPSAVADEQLGDPPKAPAEPGHTIPEGAAVGFTDDSGNEWAGVVMQHLPGGEYDVRLTDAHGQKVIATIEQLEHWQEETPAPAAPKRTRKVKDVPQA